MKDIIKTGVQEYKLNKKTFFSLMKFLNQNTVSVLIAEQKQSEKPVNLTVRSSILMDNKINGEVGTIKMYHVFYQNSSLEVRILCYLEINLFRHFRSYNTLLRSSYFLKSIAQSADQILVTCCRLFHASHTISRPP